MGTAQIINRTGINETLQKWPRRADNAAKNLYTLTLPSGSIINICWRGPTPRRKSCNRYLMGLLKPVTV